MFAKLRIKLDTNLNFCHSSNLQGVLMKQIDTCYAERLHHMSYNPYSMAVYQENKQVIWEVTTLNKEAYEKIIKRLHEESFLGFEVYHGNHKVSILEKELQTQSVESFVESIEEGWVKYELSFFTPTAFKRNGIYVFYPDIRLIFQSLMNKFNVSVNEELVYDSELLDWIEQEIELVNYSLSSTRFPLEKVKIPSFMGNLTIRLKKNNNVRKLIGILLAFGEYSGVGIKCSVGMGKIKVKKLK